jgi:hypothetical protein
MSDKLRELAGDMSAVADYIDVIQPLKDRFGVPKNIIRAWAQKLAALDVYDGLAAAFDLTMQFPTKGSANFMEGFLAGVSAYRTAIKQLQDYREKVVETNQELTGTLEANTKWLGKP